MPPIYELLQARALREAPSLPIDFGQRVQAVSDELGGLSESAQLQFFLTPKPTLGRETPLEALVWGRLPPVLAAARAFAHGAATGSGSRH